MSYFFLQYLFLISEKEVENIKAKEQIFAVDINAEPGSWAVPILFPDSTFPVSEI